MTATAPRRHTARYLRTRTIVRTLLAVAVIVYAFAAASCLAVLGAAGFVLVGPAVGLLVLVFVAVDHVHGDR